MLTLRTSQLPSPFARLGPDQGGFNPAAAHQAREGAEGRHAQVAAHGHRLVRLTRPEVGRMLTSCSTASFDYSAGDSSFSRKKQPKYASKRLQNVVEVRTFCSSSQFSLTRSSLQTWKATRDASRSPTPGAKAEANDDAKDEEATPEPLLVKKKRGALSITYLAVSLRLTGRI